VAPLCRVSSRDPIPGAALPARSLSPLGRIPRPSVSVSSPGLLASLAPLAVAAFALLICAYAGELRAEERSFPIEGVWSKDLDTCSLSNDEDETRFVIEAGEIKDYSETCRILTQSGRQDGSRIISLQCPKARGAQVMRVFRKSPDSAVFYLPENKRPRSRDVMRCPPALREPPLVGT
jgi:hypothetical protein